jgi:hypothetical protein
MRLDALQYVARQRTSDGQYDGYWRQRVEDCCSGNALQYSKFLASHKLTHRQYVDLVRTYHYYRSLSEKQWDDLEDAYGAPLHKWWDENMGDLQRVAGDGSDS